MSDNKEADCLWGSDAVVILDRLLSPEECQSHVMALLHSEDKHKSSTPHRETESINLVRPAFSDEYEARLLPRLFSGPFKEITITDSPEDIKSFGFGSAGRWRPCGVRPEWTIQSYQASTGHLNVHDDSTYIQDINKVTLVSLLIYLNEEFQEGETAFFERADEDPEGAPVCVRKEKPQTGKAVLLRAQDVLRAGLPPIGGVKVILKTDVLFQRVSEPLDAETTELIEEHARVEQQLDCMEVCSAETVQEVTRKLKSLYRRCPALESAGSLLTVSKPLTSAAV
uniref:Prolyl 4-hydroxylase alpha subunit domain-containing protein n=1 Tax=Chromera velia CCMP2878 TaxID=1169474 RepID=A0A0G4HMJ9_9ALVE|eukprot:Cvel_7504.t1-p1 / transcript=Cvel_7504.t1 / gene=Cvel_7504 / organism=Chromera_velia_CCMP2878 / gene_product=hypothetical protein / transcript_product=hypothetical protein / location=Cvel_scaffold394:27912-28757(+) / protein_length=282 / sequence_SO=supercontig / SO=protein_coding / is_pseudo=false